MKKIILKPVVLVTTRVSLADQRELDKNGNCPLTITKGFDTW